MNCSAPAVELLLIYTTLIYTPICIYIYIYRLCRVYVYIYILVDHDLWKIFKFLRASQNACRATLVKTVASGCWSPPDYLLEIG